jgi:AcrR family transcriptional regulator
MCIIVSLSPHPSVRAGRVPTDEVADIAAAAEVAPSTFFLHFSTKYDLLFNAHNGVVRGLEEALGSRPTSESTIDVLNAYFSQRLKAEESDELLVLRRRIIDGDPELVGQEQVRFSEALRPLLIAAFERDLGEKRRNDGARLLAALTVEGLNELGRIASPDGTRTGRERERQRWFLESLTSALRAAFSEISARSPTRARSSAREHA